jgi:hypothetical protein
MKEIDVKLKGIAIPEGYEVDYIGYANVGDLVFNLLNGGRVERVDYVWRHPSISIVLKQKKWKPKHGEEVYMISLSHNPIKITFSSFSMRKEYECGKIYKTEKDAYIASEALDDALIKTFEKLNYAWQEKLNE